MRQELNAIMAAQKLGLNPLNEQGIAATTLPGGTVFVYADEAAQVVRIYTSVMPWTAYYQSNAALLTQLLLQSGPNLRYPELHLGVDRNEHFLWLTMVLPEAQLNTFPEAYERFAAQAERYKAELIALINDATAAPQAQVAPAAPAAQTVAPNPAPSSAPQVDDVLSFFANPNMISV